VRDLLVEGNRVVRDGELTGVDARKIAGQAKSRVARLMS